VRLRLGVRLQCMSLKRLSTSMRFETISTLYHLRTLATFCVNSRILLRMASEFHGPIDGGIVISAPHCGSGGTMNFHFGGSTLTDGVRNAIVNLYIADHL